MSNEDSFDDQNKRMQANARFHRYKASGGLKHKVSLMGGAGSRVVLFCRDEQNGSIRPTPDYVLLASLKGYSLIIVDTLASACSGLDENDSGDMTSVMSKLAELAKETDASVMVLHHVAKGAGQRSADAVRGSTAIVNSVRTVIGLSTIATGEASKLGLAPVDLPRIVRTEVVKGNHTPSYQPRYFRKCGQNVDVDDPDNPAISPSKTSSCLSRSRLRRWPAPPPPMLTSRTSSGRCGRTTKAIPTSPSSP